MNRNLDRNTGVTHDHMILPEIGGSDTQTFTFPSKHSQLILKREFENLRLRQLSSEILNARLYKTYYKSLAAAIGRLHSILLQPNP